MAKPENTFSWVAISVAVSLLLAGLAIAEFVLEPLKTWIEVARQNLRVEFDKMERRLDSMEERLRDLERRR